MKKYMIRIRRDYKPHEMAYVHSEPTHVIWHYICDLIKQQKSKNIAVLKSLVLNISIIKIQIFF